MAGHLLTCNLGLQEHWQTNALNKGNMPASTKISVLQHLLFSAKLGLKYTIGVLLIMNESSSVKN